MRRPPENAHHRPYQWVASKLTPQQRDEIRRRLNEGEKPRSLALEYGVSTGTIRRTT